MPWHARFPEGDAAQASVEAAGHRQPPHPFFFCQEMKRLLVAKFGSLVRLTPILLRPASSPGVGMWVMCISHPLRSRIFPGRSGQRVGGGAYAQSHERLLQIEAHRLLAQNVCLEVAERLDDVRGQQLEPGRNLCQVLDGPDDEARCSVHHGELQPVIMVPSLSSMAARSRCPRSLWCCRSVHRLPPFWPAGRRCGARA